MDRRVAITGLGLVTPLGVGRAVFAERLFAGQSAIAAAEAVAAGERPTAAIGAFNARDFVSAGNLRRMDRLSAMTAAAARLALEDAALAITSANRDRVGIALGTAFGATDVAAQIGRALFTEGPGRVNPMLVPNTVMNAPAGHAAIELGLRGVNTTVNHRETSAETAIAFAADALRRGRAEAMLAGGAEILSPFCLEVLTRFRALSPLDGGRAAARPFDLNRNGCVAGEGAGVLCLELLEHARARGAQVYGEIAGWGLAAAPAPPTDWPGDARGAVLALRRAIDAARLSPAEIDCISAAANGGPRLDDLEARALELVFGSGESGPLISSLKGAIGESFSSGGIRTAALALALQRQAVPPTVGLDRPLARLRFVRQRQQHAALRYGIVNGFAAGGTFAALVLRQKESR
jgi:3-oxoacyl-[acyl-carrier-protein] synthase II